MKPINLYHVCVAKTASQWFRELFRRLQPYTGKREYHYEWQGYGRWDDRDFMSRDVGKTIFPDNVVCTPLYMGFDCYHKIPKPTTYKAFCVWRDPRDIVVSFYFSTRFSHGQIGLHPVWRKQLSSLNEEQGILWSIDKLKELRMLEANDSFKGCHHKDPCCKLYRFRDVFGGQQVEHITSLMKWLEIPVPEVDLVKLLNSISFEKRTGRQKGEEDVKKHLRKGIVGDWKNHFTPRIQERFYEAYGTDKIV